jgi:hypothetical protein
MRSSPTIITILTDMNFSSKINYKGGGTRARADRICFMSRLISAIILFAAMRSMAGEGQPLNSKWDAAIPNMELREVHLQAAGPSVSDVWRDVASQTRVRAVLFDTKPQTELQSQDIEFRFDRTNCTVNDLLDAFASAFPQYMFTQEADTGVLWLHPTNVAYTDILSGKIVVTRPAEAIPMLSGILGPLTLFRSLQLAPVPVTGGGFSSFNYPVDLPAGTYSLREIVNYCCLACPDRTFDFEPCAHESYGYSCMSICPYGKPLPPGAEFFWQKEIDPSVLQEPTEDQLIAALANQDRHIRWAARQYFDFNFMVNERFRSEMIQRAAPAATAIWVTVGIDSVVDYGMGLMSPYSPACIHRMQAVFERKEDLSGEPGLKALAAVELARVSHDFGPLREVAKQPLSAADIEDVKYDLIRNLHYSDAVRDQLAELNPPWAGFSRLEIEELGRTDNLFSLP